MLTNNAVFAVILEPTGEVALPASKEDRARAFAQQFNQLMEHTAWSAHVVPVVFKIESHVERARRTATQPDKP